MAEAEGIPKQLNVGNLALSATTNIPTLGFGAGTAWFKGPANNVEVADNDQAEFFYNVLKRGIRHLDMAEMYGNEKSVGLALERWFAEGNERSELFITGKLGHKHKPGEVQEELRKSLQRLNIDYFDLWLWHAPFVVKDRGEEFIVMWREFEACKESGKAKEIGVSNFFTAHMEELFGNELKYPPVVNQIEYNPYLSNADGLTQNAVDYCQARNIVIEVYGSLIPLGHSGPVDATLDALAEKYNVSRASILQRFILDQNMVVVTTSKKLSRLDSYPEMFSFILESKDLIAIRNACKDYSYRKFWTKDCKKLES